MKVVTQTSFYGTISLVFYFIMKALRISYTGLKRSSLTPFFKTILLPATGGTYWFVSVYVIVVLLLPLINPWLKKLSKQGFLKVLLFSWIFWYSLASFYSTPYYLIQRGLFFYCIGAYLRLHSNKRKQTPFWLLCFIVGWIISTITAFGIATTGLIHDQSQITRLLNKIFIVIESGILVPVCSIALFHIFEPLNIGSNKKINLIAATTFGVYLLHDFGIWRNLLWQKLFRLDDVLYNSRWFPLIAPAIVFIIFIVCSFIDLIRLTWIEPILTKKARILLEKIQADITSA